MAPTTCKGLVVATASAMFLGSTSALRKGVKLQTADTHVAGVPLFRAAEAPVADEWMVSFGPKATDATIEAFCANSGPCVDRGHPDGGGIAFAVVKASEESLGMSVAAHSEEVQFIEQDAIAEDFERLDETLKKKGGEPWHLTAIGKSTARNQGKGINVYVLDSGVRVSHREFGGRAIPLLDGSYTPPRVCDPTSRRCAADDRGHGTHVAGTVGSESFGVAPASNIFGMDRGQALSQGFSCIDWLAQNRKRPAVLQMSWGYRANNQVAKAAVDAAVAASITVVIASGNSNADACQYTFGFIPNAISVASSDKKMQRSGFSNWGDCIDIIAPGSSVISLDYESDTGKAGMSGTSMAAPHVSGAAALILASNPEMSPAQVKAELLANAARDVIANAKSPNLFLQVGTQPPQPPAESAKP